MFPLAKSISRLYPVSAYLIFNSSITAVQNFERPLSEDRSSRSYARPRDAKDLRPVERTIDRHATGSPGRLLVFKGLLCLGHLSCRQLFRYQYHSAPGARRKIEGEDGPQILEPDLLNFQGHLAPIADPSTITAGLRPFHHDLSSSPSCGNRRYGLDSLHRPDCIPPSR